MRKRFRLLDWKTRWFWLLIFYRNQYGETAWEVSVYRPSAADRERGWFICRPNKWGWGWEDEPDKSGQLEAVSLRGANDAEMDDINASIRREWNTPEEDKAWGNL